MEDRISTPIFFNSFIASSRSLLPRAPYHKSNKHRTMKLVKHNKANPPLILPISKEYKVPKLPIISKMRKAKRAGKEETNDVAKRNASNVSLNSVNKTPTHALEKNLISYSAMKQLGRRNDRMLYFKSSLFPIFHTTVLNQY